MEEYFNRSTKIEENFPKAAKRILAEQRQEIAKLNAQVKDLNNKYYQLSYIPDTERKTRKAQLDALGMVWCSGGCDGGMFHYNKDIKLTPEMISFVIHNTHRMVQWYVSNQGKKYYGRGGFDTRKHTWKELQKVWDKAHRDINKELGKRHYSILPPSRLKRLKWLIRAKIYNFKRRWNNSK